MRREHSFSLTFTLFCGGTVGRRKDKAMEREMGFYGEAKGTSARRGNTCLVVFTLIPYLFASFLIIRGVCKTDQITGSFPLKRRKTLRRRIMESVNELKFLGSYFKFFEEAQKF
jgi:hypothetical protein